MKDMVERYRVDGECNQVGVTFHKIWSRLEVREDIGVFFVVEYPEWANYAKVGNLCI